MSHPEPTHDDQPFGGWEPGSTRGSGSSAALSWRSWSWRSLSSPDPAVLHVLGGRHRRSAPLPLRLARDDWAASAMQRGEHTLLEYFRDKLSPAGTPAAAWASTPWGSSCSVIIYVSLTLLSQGHQMESPGSACGTATFMELCPWGSPRHRADELANVRAAREFLQSWRRPPNLLVVLIVLGCRSASPWGWPRSS